MPEAAERALVSVPTAYRYFSSADDLWWEAATVAADFGEKYVEAEQAVTAAGDDVQARLAAVLRTFGFWTLEDQIPTRQIAKFALEQWLRQASTPDQPRVPNRQGRRNEMIAHTLEPLRTAIDEPDLDRIAHALTLVVGTEAMIALSDAAGLDPDTAKQTLLDAGRWLLAGALADLNPTRSARDTAHPARTAE